MRKSTLLISTAALLAGSLAACGPSSNGTTATGSPAGSGGSGAGAGTTTTGGDTTTTGAGAGTTTGPGGNTTSTGGNTTTGTGGGNTGDYVACPTGSFPQANQLTYGPGGDTKEITADATWTKDNLYIVVGHLPISDPSGPTLTIEAGTTVCFAYDMGTGLDGGIDLGANHPGGLKMNGTAAEPVTLTSAGGVTDFWSAITASSSYTALSLAYVDFYNASDGGGQGVGAIIARANAGQVPAVTLDHVTFHQLQAGEALDLENHVGLSAGSVVTVNGFVSGTTTPQYAVVKADPISAASLQPGMLTVSATGVPAALRVVAFAEDSVTTSLTLQNVGLPYVSTGDFSVFQLGSTDPVPTLTLSAGVTWMLEPGSSLLVGGPTGYLGNLVINGTAASPVTLTSSGDTSTTGNYWGGIGFAADMASGNGFDPAVTKIDHAILQYGGNGTSLGQNNCNDPGGAGNDVSALVVIDGMQAYQGPTITNTQFSHSAADGVRAHASISGDYLNTPDYTAASTGNTFNDIAGAKQLLPVGPCP